MSFKHFFIDPEIFAKFPGLNVGVLIGKNVDNTGNSESIQTELRKEEARIRKEFQVETLGEQANIKVWREAYTTFGAKPKEHRSSIESLIRLVLRGAELRSINPLVDIYNLISLRHTLPLGGEDLDQIQGDLSLTFAGPNEVPVQCLGDEQPKTPHPGEVIYKDELSTICRRWNWREVDRTKLTEQTQNCILVIEGLPPVSKQEMETALNELKSSLEGLCGGEWRSAVLDEDQNSFR